MEALKRIRLDPDGLITQNSLGMISRIPLHTTIVRQVEADRMRTLRALKSQHGPLAELFDDDNRLSARFEIAMDEARCLNRPLRIYFGIEPRCNLHCPYCGPRDWHNRMAPGSQSQEQFLLRQIATAGAYQVQLTGGEIGLRGFDLLSTVEYAGDLGLAVILSTNGVWSCIDRKREFLAALSALGNIIQTKISIEGTPEFHDSVRGEGTYWETVKTLASLAEYGLRPRISTTVFRESCSEENLMHLVGLAKKYGAGLQTIPVRSIGRASTMKLHQPSCEQLYTYTKTATHLRHETGTAISFNFDIIEPHHRVPLFDLHRPISCGAPLWGVHVNHLGEVYPCGFSQEAGESEFLAGLVSEERSLLDVWLHSDILDRVRTAGKDQRCQTCEHYGYGCWGGCWVVGWLNTGEINGMDTYCIKPSAEADPDYLAKQ